MAFWVLAGSGNGSGLIPIQTGVSAPATGSRFQAMARETVPETVLEGGTMAVALEETMDPGMAMLQIRNA